MKNGEGLIREGAKVIVVSATGESEWSGTFIKYGEDGQAWVDLGDGFILDGVDPECVSRVKEG